MSQLRRAVAGVWWPLRPGCRCRHRTRRRRAAGKAAEGAAQPGGGLIGGTLTPKKADERGWGWQVKAMMNPATPRPLYNRA
jgi:hypothetical protein